MTSREKKLLPWIAIALLALASYYVIAQPGGESAVKELEDFRSSEQIGVDVSVPFPVDI